MERLIIIGFSISTSVLFTVIFIKLLVGKQIKPTTIPCKYCGIDVHSVTRTVNKNICRKCYHEKSIEMQAEIMCISGPQNGDEKENFYFWVGGGYDREVESRKIKVWGK